MLGYKNRVVTMLIASIVLLLTSSVRCTSGSDDVDFKPYDCFRDLCVSRRQFCSKAERRCKDCLPAHCTDPKSAPVQCQSVCSELLNVSPKHLATTSIPIPTTQQFLPGHSTATKVIPSDENPNQSLTIEQAVQDDGFIISPWMMQVGLLVILMIVITLLTINLAYTCKMHRRLPPDPPRGTAVEEGRALLGEEGEGWGSRSSRKTAGGVSQFTCASSSGSTPPKPVPTFPSPGQDNKSIQTDPSFPLSHPHLPYTARTASQLHIPECRDAITQPSADGPANTSYLHHQKGFDYHLLPLEDGGAVLPPPPIPPRRSAQASSLCHVVTDPGQELVVNEETLPKSL